MSKTPAYRQLYAELKSDIKNGKYPPGTFRPPSRSWSRFWRQPHHCPARYWHSDHRGVSFPSSRAAAQRCRLPHLPAAQYHPLRKPFSGAAILPSTQGLSVEQIPAPKYICDIFSLKEARLVHHIQRVQCADGQPISIIENFLLVSMFPDLQLSERNFVSLYAHLEEHYGIALQEATETITAIAASFTESQILRVPINTPLLLDKRITYTNNKPFEYAIIKVLADRYEYKVFLSGRG